MAQKAHRYVYRKTTVFQYTTSSSPAEKLGSMIRTEMPFKGYGTFVTMFSH